MDDADLAIGDAAAGHRRFMEWWLLGVSCCYGDCLVSPLDTRYGLLQRMLIERAARSGAPKLALSLPSGHSIVAPLVTEDEFTIVVLDPSGVRLERPGARCSLMLKPHVVYFDQLAKYTTMTCINVYAYLLTLK